MDKRLQFSNNFGLKKDGISELPDEIVVHILSFLSFKEAAATSVLSKRWLHLWTYFPRLDFDGTKLVEKIELYPKLYKEMNEKFVRWINNTLPMCKAQRLDRFRILFAIDKFVPHDIDKWLEFAFARKVQRLELDLRVGLDELYSDVDDCYAFPGQLLLRNVCQPHLDNLPPLWHNFKNVKVLLLKAVNVSDKVLEFFLHNCPFLEEMVVHGSDALVNLQVVGPSLKLKLLEKYLEHYRVPELPKLKKFVVSAFAWSDASVLGCTDAMRAAAHLEEFELKLIWTEAPEVTKRVRAGCKMSTPSPQSAQVAWILCPYQ
ncbi:FBD-associated F-box protein [Capsicum annuum]|uniref:FBD-associated F-box protein At4g10400 n=1 Tax=Capsicum annuum TaxID=4072 RepID=UPI0007BEB51C|nr:FBD-associated F-box protein At4g10400 [Capsicum annuum]